jgi:hypothetical protein
MADEPSKRLPGEVIRGKFTISTTRNDRLAIGREGIGPMTVTCGVVSLDRHLRLVVLLQVEDAFRTYWITTFAVGECERSKCGADAY